MAVLEGSPSDETPGILAVGGSNVGIAFVSFSTKHPEGRDAEYLEWHTVDHRPEQHRIKTLVASLRLVSTPECRAARAAATDAFDPVDHVMSYFFAGTDSLQEFLDLSRELHAAGRNPGPLPPVERGVFTITGRVAAPRIKISADVLPFWPVKGMYLIVEEGHRSPADLVEVPGVGGGWWGNGTPSPPSTTSDNSSLQVTYLYLDGDPVSVAHDLSGPLRQRWADGRTTPQFAAPFHTVTPYDWDRHLP